MIKKYLRAAYNSASDVIVQLDYCCNARYSGKIMDLDDDYFKLLNMDEKNSLSWIFKIEAIRYIGVYNDLDLDFVNSDSCMKSDNV